MEVKHVLKKSDFDSDTVEGILNVSLHYHGDSCSEEIFVVGSFVFGKYPIPDVVYLNNGGTIDPRTTVGLSGVSLNYTLELVD